jgi:uncharacterized membrane protein required for colicin V production
MIGLFFGSARGLIVVMIIVAVMYYLTALREEDWWQKSMLIPQVLALIEWLSPLIFSKGSPLLNAIYSNHEITGIYDYSELMKSVTR